MIVYCIMIICSPNLYDTVTYASHVDNLKVNNYNVNKNNVKRILPKTSAALFRAIK